MSIIGLILVLFLGVCAVRAQEAELLETGRAAKIADAPSAPKSLKIVSYNMRWRGGKDLEKLTRLLRDDAEIGGASVIALQEVDRNKKRTGNLNTTRHLAEQLGMYYAWAAPPAVA